MPAVSFANRSPVHRRIGGLRWTSVDWLPSAGAPPQGAWLSHKAAGVGFEPTGRLAAANGFQDRPVRPLRHPAGDNVAALTRESGLRPGAWGHRTPRGTLAERPAPPRPGSSRERRA